MWNVKDMNNYKKSNYGFTLIEIMVVVAIVGIFASIALPSFANLIERNRNTTATNELVSNLLLAKSEALKRSNNVTVCPSTDQTTCSPNRDFSTGWIIFLDCNGNDTAGEVVADCGPNGEEEIIKVREPFDSLYMRNNSDSKITFEYSGRLGSNSTFNIGKDSSSLQNRVIINRIGRVSSKKLP